MREFKYLSESTVTEIRNRAKEARDRLDREFAKPKSEAHETALYGQRKAAEALRKSGKKASLSPIQQYHYRCFYCGDWVSPGFEPSLHQDVWGKPTQPHSCGHFPYEGLHPDASSPEVYVRNRSYPYFEVSEGRDARGATYVPGKGHLIMSAAHLREFARLNGKQCR